MKNKVTLKQGVAMGLALILIVGLTLSVLGKIPFTLFAILLGGSYLIVRKWYK